MIEIFKKIIKGEKNKKTRPTIQMPEPIYPPEIYPYTINECLHNEWEPMSEVKDGRCQMYCIGCGFSSWINVSFEED